ncbi:YtxH domain-containing protein [Dysgonomonas sp. Marseille-P4677]|uniref:YtxH domain-containing protein n=1 Tax=Dysgonomonas sp. Marseille-P4677 TaxID=2364790 RepID=UPI001914CF8B|nr:YtxH domain-containing protein [Dysgonomonas sp. Marseille-P4677]MBK5721091.1 YtxH domain-containing protein [Dysgonomonas sp. Marseille-P4677]
MKKVLIGTVIGVGVSYALYKLYQQGKLDGICDDMSRFAIKTKRNLKNVVDVGKNQAEYIKERVEHEFQSGKEKFSNSKND